MTETMRRFYLDQSKMKGKDVILSGQDARHLRDVLRLKPGDRVCLFDGTGHEYLAEIGETLKDEVSLTLLDHLAYESESPVQITLVQAFLKDGKMDTLVRQVSELGIGRWLPFLAARSVARPDGERLKSRKERWIKIVREALKQCGRSRLPEISDTVSFKEAISMVSDCDVKILFWEKSDTPLSDMVQDLRSTNADCRSVCLCLGPEGGFVDAEVEEAVNQGFRTLSLGPRILKADTASVAACVLAQYLFGDMA